MNIKSRQTVSVVLSVAGGIGTIVTAYLARKAAQKELKIRDDIFKEDYENKQETPKKMVFRQIAPVYIPTLIVGVATIASTISSTLLSRKTEASLAGMALIADQGWRRYKNKVKDVLGLDKHGEILSSISKDEYKKTKPVTPEDGRKLYWEETVGFFLAVPEKLAMSYADMNQRLQVEDFGESSYYAMLYNLLNQADAELLNKKLDPEELQWGWSEQWLSQTYGYAWVHMTYHEELTDDGKEYIVVEFVEEMILDPGNHGEAFIRNDDEDDDEGQWMDDRKENSKYLKSGMDEEKKK